MGLVELSVRWAERDISYLSPVLKFFFAIYILSKPIRSFMKLMKTQNSKFHNWLFDRVNKMSDFLLLLFFTLLTKPFSRHILGWIWIFPHWNVWGQFGNWRILLLGCATSVGHFRIENVKNRLFLKIINLFIDWNLLTL